MDLARDKSEALVIILVGYSSNAKRRRQRELQKVNRPNSNEKNFARAAHFFLYISLPLFSTTTR